MKTGVVIVSYHSNKQTKAISEFYLKSPFTYICIVVNDAKSHDYLEFEMLESTRCHIIYNNENIGYAKANNIGLKYLIKNKLCEFVAISNSDIYISNKTINLLLTTLINEKAFGAMAPQMLDAAGKKVPLRYLELGYLRVFLRLFLSETFLDRILEHKLKPIHNIVYQSFLPGSFFVLRKKALIEADYLDEGTFLYREEEILGKRLKNVGYKEGVLISCNYIHDHPYQKENASKREASLKIALQSERYYFKKYYCQSYIGVLYVSFMSFLFFISRVITWRIKNIMKFFNTN